MQAVGGDECPVVEPPAAGVETRDAKDGAVERERALECIRALRRPLPPGWRFDRDDANRR